MDALDSSPSTSPPQVYSSHPLLGFHLGIALLLLAIGSLSAIFSCYYHWSSLRRPFDIERQPLALDKNTTLSSGYKGEILPVLMPGDDIPKFIALPCPCRPHRPDMVHIKVTQPPKSPRFTVPLY